MQIAKCLSRSCVIKVILCPVVARYFQLASFSNAKEFSLLIQKAFSGKIYPDTSTHMTYLVANQNTMVSQIFLYTCH